MATRKKTAEKQPEQITIPTTLETQALLLKCKAEMAEAQAVIQRYEDDSRIISIGEHPGILQVLEEAYEKLDKYTSLLGTIQNFQTLKYQKSQGAQ